MRRNSPWHSFDRNFPQQHDTTTHEKPAGGCPDFTSNLQKMKSRLRSSFALATGLALLFSGAARADENSNTIKFSDPAKPGTVKIQLGRGDLRVQGADTAEVTVKSDIQAVNNKRTRDGLRVISASSGFSLTEKDNVVTVDASPEWGRGSSSDFKLTVPRNTTVVVQSAWGGDITCAGISGDIEINSMRGEIHLDDVSGGVVAGTMSGEIHARIRELREGKPLSFTSMNGEVVIRVPESAKANVRLRTQNGSVLTDFDESVLVTKAEAGPPGFGGSKNQFVFKGAGGKVINAEVEEALREATRVSATAVKQALEAVKQGLEDSRLDQEEARRQLDEAKRDMERAKREADRQRREHERETRAAPAAPATPPAVAGSAKPAAAPKPPTMPRIPVPTMSGGKLVTGTLNGGGPEISVSTMNGDVTLRKMEAKK
jgi:hypothetical protein